MAECSLLNQFQGCLRRLHARIRVELRRPRHVFVSSASARVLDAIHAVNAAATPVRIEPTAT